MPKYRVYLETVASTSVEVEAADKDEAYEKAAGGNLPTLCHQCSGGSRYGQNMELGDVWEIPQTLSADEAIEEIED